jgi:hypothetical protein
MMHGHMSFRGPRHEWEMHAVYWLSSYRNEVAKELIVHVRLRQESCHQQLLLPHADAW